MADVVNQSRTSAFKALRTIRKMTPNGKIQACKELLKAELSRCPICGSQASSKCQSCEQVYYCSREHQKEDWPNHRHECCELCQAALTETADTTSLIEDTVSCQPCDMAHERPEEEDTGDVPPVLYVVVPKGILAQQECSGIYSLTKLGPATYIWRCFNRVLAQEDDNRRSVNFRISSSIFPRVVELSQAYFAEWK